MTTFTNLVTAVSRDLRDTGNTTFTTPVVGDLINEGLVEIGRIAPARFQQDLTVVANTLVYPLHGDAAAEISLARVEVWDITTNPDSFVGHVRPIAGEYSKASPAGWYVWDGKLYIPNGLEAYLVVGRHVIRVWGYGPYPLVSGSTEMGVSVELEYAIRAYARLAGLERLQLERDLFAQWASQTQNTDVSPAGLLGMLNSARDDWRRRARNLLVLRENP